MSAELASVGSELAMVCASTPITYTRFVGFGAAGKSEQTVKLGELVELIRTKTAPAKADLPLLKLARFGEDRTEKGSLRHDANVRAITGIEADYDDEEISFQRAIETIIRARLLAIIYTSPNHTPEKPRWRVLCPTSRELPPFERARLVSRLNGLFGGIFAAESWTLSQAYYFGFVADNPNHQVVLVDGAPIDLHHDLDTSAIGKSGTKQLGGRAAASDPLDEEGFLDTITRGESFHNPIVRLAGRYAAIGLPVDEAERRIREAIDRVLPEDRDERWHLRRQDVTRCVEDIYAKEAASSRRWLSLCQTNAKGAVRADLANAMIALRQAPELQDLLGYDEMQRAPLLLKPVPRSGEQPSIFPRPLRDTDITALQEWLQLAGLVGLAKEVTHQAVDLRAIECGFHPVRSYLAELHWDGVPRLGQWLHRYLGVEQSAYAEGIGTMFFIAMVVRILKPGCKVDYMLVLEGSQGAGKSTACRILGGACYSDALPDIRSGKDVSQHLNGKWLIEVAELSALDRAEAAALKAFITRTVERYRPSYGRREVVEPRQCVFIGTTNKDAYLRDETGARRFWSVKVGRIDTDALQRDRDQLFAEAVHLYRSGTSWWPTAEFEAAHIVPEQEQRFEDDVWEQAVAEYVEPRPFVTMTEVAQHAVKLDTPTISITHQRRITSILLRLGWVRAPRSGKARRWIRGSDA